MKLLSQKAKIKSIRFLVFCIVGTLFYKCKKDSNLQTCFTISSDNNPTIECKSPIIIDDSLFRYLESDLYDFHNIPKIENNCLILAPRYNACEIIHGNFALYSTDLVDTNTIPFSRKIKLILNNTNLDSCLISSHQLYNLINLQLDNQDSLMLNLLGDINFSLIYKY